MFPVGLCTKFGVSSPVVKNGTFAGFYDGWLGGRKFPVDMAGFAINLDFLLKVGECVCTCAIRDHTRLISFMCGEREREKKKQPR